MRATSTIVAVLALACTGPKPKTTTAEPCDPAVDLHACTSDGARLTCDPRTSTWTTTGYCPAGSECALAPLPAGVTPAGAFAAACRAAGTAVAVDGSGSDGGQPFVGPGTRVGGGSTDAGSDVDVPPQHDSADVASPLCGNGVCDQGESATACAKDCGPPVCGDNACTAQEDSSSCAWDCVAGAAAGAVCMTEKCPGASAACKASPACMRKLAQVWACAKGCAPCLNSCLQQLGTDAVAYAAASCGGQQCL
ncbi:MAG: hypothetical protein FJ100_21935 [Deltaproteobacteria bacterium]|nr:hypothetical protein [Deltaproteobacteria bacterium]